MKKALYLGLALVLLITCLVGCAKRENRVVAKVGDREITLGEFEEGLSAQIGMAAASGAQIPQREDILKDMINRELLIVYGYKEGLDKDTEIDSLLAQKKNDFLLEELYKVEVANKSKTTPREIESFYDKLKEKMRARHILVKSKQEADSIYDMLEKGADFEKLAKEKSIDKFTASRGGDVGFFSWGDMVEPFQEAVVKLKPKEISKPVKTKFGWHIIRLEEKQQAQLPDFKTNQQTYAQQLQRTKQNQLLIRYVDKLREKENMKVDSLVFNFLLAKASQLDSASGERKISGEISPYIFTPVESEAVLVKYRSGQMTLNDFVLKFNSVSPNMRVYGFKDRDGLADFVFQMLLPELLAQAAYKEGIDKSESYKKKIESLKGSLIASKMRDKFILDTVGITPEEIDEYYQKHKDAYIVPAAVHLAEIMLSSKEEADEVLKKIKSGEDFAKLAKEKTLRTYAKTNGGDLGYIQESQSPEFFTAGWGLKKGAVAGPIFLQDPQFGKVYSIIKLLDKKEKKEASFDQVKEDVEKRALWEKKNSVLENWATKAKEQIKVQIYRDVLGMAKENNTKVKG